LDANGSLERSRSEQSITRDGICRDGIRSPGTSDNKTTVVIPQEENIMSTIFKIILGTAIAAVSIASPALAQHGSEKGHLMSVRHSEHVRIATHRSALRSFASLPRSVDDPAVAGGGSIGYNANLRLNRW
jgi:hypothetical protein